MKVGIDARFVTRYPRRGIGNYSLNLISELAKLDSKIEYILYIYHSDEEKLLPTLPNVEISPLRVPLYPLWEQIALPLAANRDKLDILHCLGNTAPLFISRSTRLLLTVHDAMFLQSGTFVPKPRNSYQALGRLYRSIISPRCIRHASGIITVSEYSRQDILKLIPNINPDIIFVTHQSCDKAFRESFSSDNKKIEEILPDNQSYIFALGADDPRKNTLRLVNAYLTVLKKYDIKDSLVISGYSNWEQSDAYQAVRNAGAVDKVKFLSFISVEELSILYKNAKFFIYPSLYEGFGIPLLEAFSSGCPVIASNVTSIPEVAGNAVVYIDPHNQENIENAIYQLIQDDKLRQILVECGYKQALKFSWQETAEKTLSLYKQCIQDS